MSNKPTTTTAVKMPLKLVKIAAPPSMPATTSSASSATEGPLITKSGGLRASALATQGALDALKVMADATAKLPSKEELPVIIVRARTADLTTPLTKKSGRPAIHTVLTTVTAEGSQTPSVSQQTEPSMSQSLSLPQPDFGSPSYMSSLNSSTTREKRERDADTINLFGVFFRRKTLHGSQGV